MELEYYQTLNSLITPFISISIISLLLLIVVPLLKLIINIFRPEENYLKWKYAKRSLGVIFLVSFFGFLYVVEEADEVSDELAKEYKDFLIENSKDFIFERAWEDKIERFVDLRLTRGEIPTIEEIVYIDPNWQKGCTSPMCIRRVKKIEDYFINNSENFICQTTDGTLGNYSRLGDKHTLEIIFIDQERITVEGRWEGPVGEMVEGPEESYQTVGKYDRDGSYTTKYGYRWAHLDFNFKLEKLNFRETEKPMQVGCWNRFKCPSVYIGTDREYEMSCNQVASSEEFIKLLQSKIN